MKYIIVTGGVISGLGKGIVASSLGLLLKGFNLQLTAVKIDPYINIDAGTFSPYEHGEVFVLDDGGEVDLDLGNYERFLNIRLSRDNNITSGKIFERVISKERRGDYLGRTVQYVPHVTTEIQDWVERAAHKPVLSEENRDSGIADVCIVELGGTIGDIESAPFVEAFRFFQNKVGMENFLIVHLSPILESKAIGEPKTKPTQRSVMELRKLGLHPDIIMCRCQKPLTPELKNKLSLFCNVTSDQIVSVTDVESLYEVPIMLYEQNVVNLINNKLKLHLAIPSNIRALPKTSLISKWIELVEKQSKCSQLVNIVLVGKYTRFEDSYASVIKALNHSAIKLERLLKVTFVEATDLEMDTSEKSPENYRIAWKNIEKMDGLLVPGGFDYRGVEGKIRAIEYARLNKKPFLGICLGFQCATMEFARNVCGLEGANSTEFLSQTRHKVVIDMPEHTSGDKGGTMRLGVRDTNFTTKDSLLYKLYGQKDKIRERHRHRYEVNPDYVDILEKKGLNFTGKDNENIRMQILELKDHPYFVAVQFHPEFTSRPFEPSPPFLGLIASAIKNLDRVLQNGSQS